MSIGDTRKEQDSREQQRLPEEHENLRTARSVADTVLFEGYMLYPYRANDAKNRVRWQFGVLAPPQYVELDPSEHSWLQADVLVEGPDPVVTARVRFLQVQRRRVEARSDGRYHDVDSLDVGRATYLPWDEAIVQELTVHLPLDGPVELHLPAGAESEDLRADNGQIVGRLSREREPLDAVLNAELVPQLGPYGVRRLRVRLSNTTEWTALPDQSPSQQRPRALGCSLVAAHLLLSVTGGAFISQLERPEWASGYVAECENVGTFPVLAGPSGSRDVVLASPIILYDHPQVAPESAMAFCDATEMDEMLTLRTMTLTDQEKREVRGSDPRAAALMDQVDDLPPELLSRLHGAIRSLSSSPSRPPPAQAPDEVPPWWDPGSDAGVSPETDSLLIDGVVVQAGDGVLLRPGRRRADAQDMFLDGRAATVAAVFFDVDGGSHLAVTLDDLSEEFPNPHGRFLYFQPDEVEPLRVRS
jgi:hypothetical protein